MIAVKEVSSGVFERISGSGVLESFDGELRAPIDVVLHESWSDEDRAAFGVYLVQPAVVPQGHRIVTSEFVRNAGIVEHQITTEPIPSVERDDWAGITPRELVVAMATELVTNNITTQSRATAWAQGVRDRLRRAI